MFGQIKCLLTMSFTVVKLKKFRTYIWLSNPVAKENMQNDTNSSSAICPKWPP